MVSRRQQRRKFLVVETVAHNKVSLEMIDGRLYCEPNPSVLDKSCIVSSFRLEACSSLSMKNLGSILSDYLCQDGSKVLESTEVLYDCVKGLLEKQGNVCHPSAAKSTNEGSPVHSCKNLGSSLSDRLCQNDSKRLESTEVPYDCVKGLFKKQGNVCHPSTAEFTNEGSPVQSCQHLVVASPIPCANEWVAFGDDDRIVAQFERDGFVVVENVFSQEEINKAVDELWESPQLLGRDPAIKRDDPSTWGCEHWPQADGDKNFLQSLEPYQDRACWEFTQNLNAVHVLKLLWRQNGVEDICIPGASRWGVMRPTAINPAWRTKENWLHWDQNPWSEPGFGHVQAFACVSEQTETRGGLLCVPGFHKRWRQWGADHPEGTVKVDGRIIDQSFGRGCPFPVPPGDAAHQQVVRVLAPAGALVLWDSRLPHQNFPNSGMEFRMVLYTSYVPCSDQLMADRREALRRKKIVMRVLGRPEGFWPNGLTELGRKLTGTPDPADIERIECEMKDGSNPDFAALVKAIKLCQEAADLELQGDAIGHVEKLRAAEKAYADIERWHPEIFP